MSSFAALLVLLNAGALLVAPRRWALLPLIMGTCYIPFYQDIELGPLHFTAIRILIAVGAIRIILRGESSLRAINGLDRAMLAWAAWLLASSIFHKDPSSAVIYRLGLVYDAGGFYILVRALCRSIDDVRNACQQVAIVLLPLAAEMLYEVMTAHNLFLMLSGANDVPLIREGRVRANGPFGHPILAGTVGAVCLPLMIGLWATRRKAALLGMAACAAIIFASASSGPILSAMAGIFAVFMWHYRTRMRLVRWLAVAGYIALDVVMKDPAYFLVARVDLAGGSTSWYRARLIQSAFEHLDEWWLTGTDSTRHWMWVVVSWSTNHTDITSHYIQMGVWGGLPLILLFILVLMKGFSGVTQVVRRQPILPPGSAFLLWTVGSSLFSLAVTGFSVSYFDQSFVFLYLILGAIGSAWSSAVSSARGHKVVGQKPNLAGPEDVPRWRARAYGSIGAQRGDPGSRESLWRVTNMPKGAGSSSSRGRSGPPAKRDVVRSHER